MICGGSVGDGDTAIVTFGSSVGPAREASRRLARNGRNLRVVALRQLSPLPLQSLANALSGARRTIVLEQNHGAQLYRHLRGYGAVGTDCESIARPRPAAISAGRNHRSRDLKGCRHEHCRYRAARLRQSAGRQGFQVRCASDLVSRLRHFGVLAALERGLALHGRPPHECALISGIGCSSRLPAYTSCYGFHGVHGRALPVATGLKLARPDLEVIAVGGDGDGYSIGGNHFIHACRRNVDIVYIVMDNRVYGMTKGQPSPTTEPDWDSDIAPGGIGLRPFNPLSLAIAAGANFVARGFSGEPDGLAEMIVEAIRWPGFAFIEVLSPCITFASRRVRLEGKGPTQRVARGEGQSGSDRGRSRRRWLQSRRALPGSRRAPIAQPLPAIGTLIEIEASFGVG